MRNIFLSLSVPLLSLLVPGAVQAHDFGPEPLASIFDEYDPIDEQGEFLIAEVGVSVARALVDRYKLWPAGDVLTFCFFPSDQRLRQFFVQSADEWQRHVNLKFDFGASPGYRDCTAAAPSKIRVDFNLNYGSESYVGTDALRVAVTRSTMNINPQAQLAFMGEGHWREMKRVILHEIGHALAFEHEHQHPDARCEAEIDWDIVYRELGRQGWSRDEVDRNLRRYFGERYRATLYDRQSIMHYSLPGNWFIAGTSSSCFIRPNFVLSDVDKAYASQLYPATSFAQGLYVHQLDLRTAELLTMLNASPEIVMQAQEAISAAAFELRSEGIEPIIRFDPIQIDRLRDQVDLDMQIDIQYPILETPGALDTLVLVPAN